MGGFFEGSVKRCLRLIADTSCDLENRIFPLKLAKAITITKGHPEKGLLNAFYEVGYSQGALIDLVMLVGDRVILNYTYALTQVPVDFPPMPPLD